MQQAGGGERSGPVLVPAAAALPSMAQPCTAAAEARLMCVV